MGNFFNNLGLEARQEAIKELKQEYFAEENFEALKIIKDKIEERDDNDRLN